MKQFLKFTLAALVAILISGAVLVAVGIGTVAAFTSKEEAATVVNDHSVLYLSLSGEIVEHTQKNTIDDIMGYGTGRKSLATIVKAIDKAATCANISGIYIEAGVIQADYASLQELRNALVRFKTAKKGKAKVIAFANEYTQGAYYVCSAADEIWMNPKGILDIHGLSATPMYYKDVLARFGVKMTVVKVGQYKSATEPYTETKMSDANRKQVSRFISDIWNTVTKDIAASRKLSVDKLNAIADSTTALLPAEGIKKLGLVDKLVYADDVATNMKAVLGIDKDKDIEQVTCSDMARYEEDILPSSDNIAVIYCQGTIVQTEAMNTLSSDGGIVSQSMIGLLKDIKNDDDIKAVVLRINSGGGDAFASEEIWHAITELKKSKPVVVSMSGAAASGAYYMSAPASWIVAQPTTLTGSIGIFGLFPDLTGLTQGVIGLKFDNVKTNAHADMDFTQTSRPFNTQELSMLQAYIDRGYELFCKRVSDGRKIPLARVKEIAQGRVWTGRDAKSIGLVDQLGGVPEAMAKAAELAKLKSYSVSTYPKDKDLFGQLQETTGHYNNLDEQLHETLGTMYEPFRQVRTLEKTSKVQAMLPWYLNIK